ncbi:hypothetical protein JOD54_000927 [Actinokineospora baliensis]|uniref:hypothetical protein n=1 Tax=Actinokineospora baliensis TaxID=547056 RepID=UPI00195A379A|nr:hypothetical protein [Actinokineospora baliensis]MBM7770723.1 hypothetical protein [Actinokineospora baliensis]
MTDNVRDLLGKAFGDEPPLGVDREAVFAEGRRRLRRRRAAASGGVAAAVAVAVFGAAALSGGALGIGQPEVIPAAPPSSAGATSVPEPQPIKPPVSAQVTTTTKLPTTFAPRQADLLRKAGLVWPAEVSLRSQRAGRQWYEFNDDGEANIILGTPKGPRVLVIRVYFTTAQEHMIECLNAQTRKPLPNCSRSVVNGAQVRINRDYPPDGPAVVLVTADRPDGGTVEVMETADLGGRLDQVIPDSTLTRIATLPGLTP